MKRMFSENMINSNELGHTITMKKILLASFLLLTLLSLNCRSAQAESLSLLPYYSNEASSWLESSENSYAPFHINDGDLSTAWVEGVEGDGIGESILLRSAPFSVIKEMTIWPGYYKSADLYQKNSVPTGIRISSGSSRADFDLSAYHPAYAENSPGYSIPFPEGFVTDGMITLTILGARSGSLYHDSCLSEVHFYGERGDELLFQEAGILTWIYLNRFETWGDYRSDMVTKEDLRPDDLANGIYWYQYHMEDPRILNQKPETNTLSLETITSIMMELFGRADEEALRILGEEYGSIENGEYELYSTGDYGDVPVVSCERRTFEKEGEDCIVRGDMRDMWGTIVGSFEGRFSSGSEKSGIHMFQSLTVEIFDR